jgi:hypothetical protein
MSSVLPAFLIWFVSGHVCSSMLVSWCSIIIYRRAGFLVLHMDGAQFSRAKACQYGICC